MKTAAAKMPRIVKPPCKSSGQFQQAMRPLVNGMLENFAALPPLFREQPGDGGAQFRDAGPAARRSDEHIRECRRMRRERGNGGTEAGRKLRRLDLIGLGENDLVAHRG